MQKSDPLGYYAALNISPGASREEVRLAYRFLKKSYLETRNRKIDISKAQAAYEMLNDPKRKSAYDRGDVSGARAGGAGPFVGSGDCLAVWACFQVSCVVSWGAWAARLLA